MRYYSHNKLRNFHGTYAVFVEHEDILKKKAYLATAEQKTSLEF